jgi:hypothetical protein
VACGCVEREMNVATYAVAGGCECRRLWSVCHGVHEVVEERDRRSQPNSVLGKVNPKLVCVCNKDAVMAKARSSVLAAACIVAILIRAPRIKYNAIALCCRERR